jgi:hypothetical protein
LLAAVPKYCPPATVAVVTEVTNPLPFTVTTGIELAEPNEPVVLFTVARVKADVPAVAVASPVKAGSLAAGKVPLAMLVALVVSVVAEATKPRFVLAVDTEAKSERLFALRANKAVSIEAAELAALVAEVDAELAEEAAAVAED